MELNVNERTCEVAGRVNYGVEATMEKESQRMANRANDRHAHHHESSDRLVLILLYQTVVPQAAGRIILYLNGGV